MQQESKGTVHCRPWSSTRRNSLGVQACSDRPIGVHYKLGRLLPSVVQTDMGAVQQVGVPGGWVAGFRGGGVEWWNGGMFFTAGSSHVILESYAHT